MNATISRHRLIPSVPYPSYSSFRAEMGACAVSNARRMTPDAVVSELERSGLRGRGGAGFPVGRKWRTIYSHPCRTRSVVCNAAEGEPGTFKDRLLIRHNPYSLIEGMLIAAHAIGTRELYIGINALYTQERNSLETALREVTAAGLLGDCGFRIIPGPDEYLFGEEKALLEVIEGNDALPREAHYPPYEKGLFATVTSPNPALVNNAETFAHAAEIVRFGADEFRALGTSDTTGTVLFTVCGDVRRPGVYELEAGITLRELFHDIAGGPLEGRTFKTALAGVSTRVIPESRFDTVADFGSLQAIGAGLGSAGFMLFDNSRSMVRVAQSVARFLYVESCDQCTACKYGLGIASGALDKLVDGTTLQPQTDQVAQALHGALGAPSSNRCYLPVQGSLLIPSLIECFGDEFRAQAADPTRATDPVPLFKIVDFDAASRQFVYG